MDRIERLHELQSLISPLNEQRNFLALKKYLNQITAAEEGELTSLIQELLPLVKEFDEKRVRYWITYKGKLYDHLNNSSYWGEPIVQQRFFFTDCLIDSLNTQSVNLPNCSQLIAEVGNYIYIQQYNEYEILNIARVK
jgi:hypothetical protein